MIVRTVVLLSIVACLAVAGCSGDDGDGKEAGPGEAPASGPASQGAEPEQEIEEFAQLVETAITSPDCEGLTTKVNKPEEGGMEIACPAEVAKAGRAYAGYRTLGAESYGTGAVIDYQAAEAPMGGTWELSLGSDGTWVIDAGKMTGEKTSGTELENRAGFDRALGRFLTAVRDSDCDTFFEYAETFTEDKQKACGDELPFYDALATALAASPDDAPFFLGGNHRYAFYGLETAKPKPAYRTVTVERTAHGSDRPYVVARTKLGPEP